MRLHCDFSLSRRIRRYLTGDPRGIHPSPAHRHLPPGLFPGTRGAAHALRRAHRRVPPPGRSPRLSEPQRTGRAAARPAAPAPRGLTLQVLLLRALSRHGWRAAGHALTAPPRARPQRAPSRPVTSHRPARPLAAAEGRGGAGVGGRALPQRPSGRHDGWEGTGPGGETGKTGENGEKRDNGAGSRSTSRGTALMSPQHIARPPALCPLSAPLGPPARRPLPLGASRISRRARRGCKRIHLRL